ncbi:hypothetical protein D1BOALGB6SA_2730 [Olavius sp. associated proteobacterium Delta 1]|nr:hypothetical protein D1BOALGB6SA_2730 [Olavius sp. associated proteobacterium Delta 1]
MLWHKCPKWDYSIPPLFPLLFQVIIGSFFNVGQKSPYFISSNPNIVGSKIPILIDNY